MTPVRIDVACVSRAELERERLVAPGAPLRLHLGCGEVRLNGFVNVDFPPSEHTVQQTTAADVYADITRLRFAAGTVDEIRLHHVFEHFDRPTAHALLARWQQWLRVGGELVIETPDLRACSRLLTDRSLSYAEQQVVIRHLFGSHEAPWAVHWDGWYEDKYRRVLGALGYHELQFEHAHWKLTHNVIVRARKRASLSPASLRGRIGELLYENLVDSSPSEQALWDIWRDRVAAMLPDDAVPDAAPDVSIFVPAYNRERYLPETLDSLLAQSFRSLEVIVADDGSTDGTLRVAREYAERDPRVRVLALPHQGEVGARNSAIRAAHPDSRFLMNHDSDDISLPTKVERLVAHLESHPDVALVGCLARYFDDAGTDLGAPELEHRADRILATYADRNSLVNSATLIRREVFDTLHGYRQAFASVDDYDFFARAMNHGFRAANVPELLHRIRLHPGSISQLRARRTRLLAERVRADFAYGQARRNGGGAPAWVRSRVRRGRALLEYWRDSVLGR